LVCSFSLSWVICYGAFYLHVVPSSLVHNIHSLTIYKRGLYKVTSSLMKKRGNKKTMMHAATLKVGAQME
jgi:hypothetical protein